MATPEPSIANYDESLILDSVDRFLERDVRPHVRELEENDILARRDRREDEGARALRGDHRGGVRWARPVRLDLFPDRGARLGGVDVGIGHLQLAPHHGRRHRALRHRSPEAALPSTVCERRATRRGRADRARLRDGPAGDPHPGGEARRPLRGQRHQDVDQQQRSRKHSHRAGEDRFGRQSSPQGHEPC